MPSTISQKYFAHPHYFDIFARIAIGNEASQEYVLSRSTGELVVKTISYDEGRFFGEWTKLTKKQVKTSTFNIPDYNEWKDKIPPPPYTTDDEEEEMTQSNVAACMDMTSVMSDFEMIDGQLVIKKKRYPYKIIKRSQQRKDKEFEALKKRVEDREKGGIDMKKWNKSLNKTMMNIYKTNPKAAKTMDRMEAMLEGMYKF